VPGDGDTIDPVGPRSPANDEEPGVNVLHEQVVPAKSGHVVEVAKGQHLRITDLEGKQVVDMAVFNRHNLRDKISTAYSRSRQPPKPGEGFRSLERLLEGHVLLSTVCTPLMTIVKETAEPKGVHDTYNRMCNRLYYESFGVPGKDGCLEIISALMAPYGLRPEELPNPLNVFMNLEHDCASHQWVLKEPVTRPGDYLELRAEIDCLVAMSNCPEDTITPCNGYHCTPVKVEVLAP
jgi:uncharacterized protein YcgI (DUF1989 family)